MDTPDLLVVGAGVAGLYAALNAAQAGLAVTVLCAGPRLGGSTRWAQGGAAAPLDSWDQPAHAADTLAAGRGLCEPSAVRAFVQEAGGHLERLADLGLPFAAEMGLEGGHSRARVRHAYGDATGLAVSRTLNAAVDAAGVTVHEGVRVQRLLLAGDRVAGVLAGPARPGGHGRAEVLRAGAVLLATGGYGSLFPLSTAPAGTVGSGLILAALAGAALRDLEFMQFHPTAVVVGGEVQLVSEAVRGAGGILRNALGERFMPALDPQAELAPRDVVARAIAHEQRRTGQVTLDISQLGRAEVLRRFPGISARLAALGLDLGGGPVPVQPAAHYSVGGVATDLHGFSGVPGLYVAGEAASTGLHGANRLASNSLSEGLVFGARAAQAAAAATPGTLPGCTVQAGTVPAPALRAAGSWAGWRPWFAQAAGLVRSGADLAAALREAPPVQFAAASGARASQAACILLAGGILQAALARHETRGAHARAEWAGPQGQPQHSELRLCGVPSAAAAPGEPARWVLSRGVAAGGEPPPLASAPPFFLRDVQRGRWPEGDL